MVDSEHPSRSELIFLQLVSMFQVAAMQQLGKFVNPVTNEVERDLEQARVSIDTLDVLKEKTKGNLTVEEEEFLDKVLFELHMNYVDELKREPEEKTSEELKKDKNPKKQTEPARGLSLSYSVKTTEGVAINHNSELIGFVAKHGSMILLVDEDLEELFPDR